MILEQNNAAEVVASSHVMNESSNDETMTVCGHYTNICYGPDGEEKWREEIDNLITYQGKNTILNTTFNAGTTNPPYMSLITAGTATTASTYAAPITTEVTSAVIAARLPMTFTASANGTKTSVTNTFSITGSATITGNLVVSGTGSITSVGDTLTANGVMISSAPFTNSRAVYSGDSLAVGYSISI